MKATPTLGEFAGRLGSLPPSSPARRLADRFVKACRTLDALYKLALAAFDIGRHATPRDRVRLVAGFLHREARRYGIELNDQDAQALAQELVRFVESYL